MSNKLLLVIISLLVANLVVGIVNKPSDTLQGDANADGSIGLVRPWFIADRQFVPVLIRAPATLQAIYTALEARIFVDHADRQFVSVLMRAPTTLQAIYTTLAARIFVDHADAQFVPVLVPIILDNGVPTGTVARGATQPDQTPRPSMTSTPTATPSVEARVVPSDSPVPTITAQDVATMTVEPTTTIALTTTVVSSATPQP